MKTRSKRPWPLVRALLTWTAAVVALTLILASALVLEHELRFTRREMERQAALLGQSLAAVALGPGTAAATDLAVSRSPDLVAASVEDAGGRTLWRFGPPAADMVGAASSRDLLIVEREVRVLDASTGSVVPVRTRVILSLRRLRLHLMETAMRMVLSLGAGLAVLLVLGAAAAERLVEPLERLAVWARRAGPGEAGPPPAGGSREVVELARAFGELVGRLEEERTALEASEQRLRELFDVAPAPMLVVDTAGKIVRANRAAAPFLGVGPEDAAGLELARFTPAEPGEGETRWLMPSGETVPVELARRGGIGPGGEGELIVIHDLSDRLRREGERWRATFDAMADGVALIDDRGQPVLRNAAMEVLWPDVGKALESRSRAPGEAWRLETANRSLLLRLSPGPDGTILTARDVTELTEAERRLREALRAEAVATLAAGVAHDFNNLLAAMELHVRLLEADPAGVTDSAAAIRELAARGRDLVNQLVDRANEGGSERELVDLRALLEDLESFLRFLVEPTIGLELDPGQAGLVVCVDRASFRRVLLNLVVNARRAIGDGGGTIRIALARRGRFAELSVEDDGSGLPPGDPERLFELHVSEEGGRGLGLAVAAAIVEDHGGSIAASSRPGGGARFTVRLPLADMDGCADGPEVVP